MIQFFKTNGQTVIAVDSVTSLSNIYIDKLIWLSYGAEHIKGDHLDGWFIGPRKEMITPWSTNAVEITQNMGIYGIVRIEEFFMV